MRPIIKKKRIDPRYFLHETVEEGIKLSVRQKAVMDKDDDGDIDGDDLAALRSQEEHEKSDDEDGDGVRDPKDRPGLTLLKGEKTLYEKIRNAIEEMLDEYLEEQATERNVPGGGYKPERPPEDPIYNEIINSLLDPIYNTEAGSALQAYHPERFNPPPPSRQDEEDY